MKVIFDKQETEVSVYNIDKLYVVGKDLDGRGLLLQPIKHESEYWKFTIVDSLKGNSYGGSTQTYKIDLLQSNSNFELHAFNTWQEAYKWLIDNCE